MQNLYLLLFALLVGCHPPVVPNPPPDPADTDSCGAAEDRLEELQCFDSSGDPMWVNRIGEPFQETCRKAQEEALIFVNPRCVVEALTCNEANRCPAAAH